MVYEKELDRNANVRRIAHESLDMIMNQAEGIRENSRETADTVKEKVIMARENANDYISKNQEKSVLIAAGVGFVVGAVIVAAMTRKKHESCP
jgi:ElaB/YqjD/DUF883 family membrane-anchored ribosome-binding protein